MKLIKISDEKDCIISVSLNELIVDMKPFISNLNFCLYELDAIGCEDIDYYLGTMSDEVNSSEYGTAIRMNDLIYKSSQLKQVINFILVGNSKIKINDKYLAEHHWMNEQEIIIQMLDGDCWEVFTHNLDIANFLQNKYSEVEICDVK